MPFAMFYQSISNNGEAKIQPMGFLNTGALQVVLEHIQRVRKKKCNGLQGSVQCDQEIPTTALQERPDYSRNSSFVKDIYP